MPSNIMAHFFVFNAVDVQLLSIPCWCFPGVLACLDGYMNIALEQTEEYVNGQLKNKYGDAFIRGNNGGWKNVYL